MSAAPFTDLEPFRPLLRLQARSLHLGPRLRARFDESDLVQEAMGRACFNLAQFRGTTEAELVVWLQAILGSALKDLIRREKADKRDVDRERRIEAAIGESSCQMGDWLAAKVETPSVEVRREELVLRVAAAVDRLEPDQRDAVILREMQGLTVAEIAVQMSRTEKSVGGLLLRGRQRLRELVAEEAEGQN